MDPERITYFAQTDARGKREKFGIKALDRTKHMYIIGKTGMGKSTLIENLIVQDIQNGEGCAFIDPHGGSAEDILDFVPEERINDVVYFAPFDMDNPVAFNVMEDVGYDKRHLVVSGLMSAFEKIWEDAWSARMEYILTNTLLALLEYPNSTMLDVNRMYSDKTFRDAVVDHVKDPLVKSFWKEEFAGFSDRYAQEATPAIQNKIGQFTGNPLIRNIIGQPKSAFDIRDIMDNRKILICNLSKGRMGETNANLLGSMLITKIYLAAMSRADKTKKQIDKLPNFYFYVDEFQSFANKSFADILSEARKYKLNLTIAHQYIEQMSDEVRAAVFGNVGTMITFRVGAYDAEVLEKEFSPQFEADDLVNLGIYQIYLKLMIDGIGSSPFSATTLPPIGGQEVSYRDLVVDASRKNYSANRDDIEKKIADEHAAREEAKLEAHKEASAAGQNKGGRKPAPNGKPPQREGGKREFQKKETPKMEESNHKEQLADIMKSMGVKTDPKPHEVAKDAPKKSHDERRKEKEAKDAKRKENRLSKEKNDLANALSAVMGNSAGNSSKLDEINKKSEANTAKRESQPFNNENKKPAGRQQAKSDTKKSKSETQKREVPEEVLKKVLDVEGEQ